MAFGNILKKVTVTDNGQQSLQWWMIRNDLDALEWKPILCESGTENIIQKPIWAPLPGSQKLFLECPVYEALYYGTRGSGKSLLLLMDFAKEVGKGFGNSWRGVLFRRGYKDLDDTVKKIEEWFPKMFPGFRFLRSKADYQAIWPTGEVLLLRVMEDESGYDSYHGQEYPWIGFEELTQWETDKAYLKIQSCSRSPIAGIRPRVRAATNPYGAGKPWIKRRFKLPEMTGKVIRNPGELPRVSIFGALGENFILLTNQPEYPNIVRQSASNPAEAEAWLRGSWDASSGGLFDDIWDRSIHVVPDIPADRIPRGWTISRAYDHGQSHPFAVGWWLESNGEPIDIAGRQIGAVRGDLILWKEWYGTSGEPNEGLRMPSSKIARGIKDREIDEGVWGRVVPGPADNQIFNREADRDNRGPADDMEDEGIRWERCDKTPGSRARGWMTLRNRLEEAKGSAEGYRENPGLFVCSRCRYWIELVPTMPRGYKDQDDCPPKYEDHLGDMTRYRLSWEQQELWRRGF